MPNEVAAKTPSIFLRDDATERFKRMARDLEISLNWAEAQKYPEFKNWNFGSIYAGFLKLASIAEKEGKTEVTSIEEAEAQDPVALMEARVKAMKAAHEATLPKPQ